MPTTSMSLFPWPLNSATNKAVTVRWTAAADTELYFWGTQTGKKDLPLSQGSGQKDKGPLFGEPRSGSEITLIEKEIDKNA